MTTTRKDAPEKPWLDEEELKKFLADHFMLRRPSIYGAVTLGELADLSERLMKYINEHRINP